MLVQPELVRIQATKVTISLSVSLSLSDSVEQLLTTSFQPEQRRCSRLTVTLPFCRMS